MKEIMISGREEGQRLDRFLQKYLSAAQGSFIYKMLRKKNITLNGKKAEGAVHLKAGDVIRIYFADETLAKYTGGAYVPGGNTGGTHTPGGNAGGTYDPAGSGGRAAAPADDSCAAGAWPRTRLDVLAEDEHLILINKRSGMLTQKARPEDVSLAEYLIGHLLREGALTEEELRILRPAPCNRLDRNTSGIVICGKTMAGLQEASTMIRERTLQKYYLCPVLGEIREEMLLEGYLVKDERTNRVSVTAENVPGSTRIITGYRPAGYCRIQNGRRTVISTLLEVHLVTGKSHQIRAHLESIGHPVLGDPKYGDPGVNEALRRDFGLRSQLLHCHRVVFPHLEGQLAAWSGREITAPVPGRFLQITKNSIVI